jgi:hypothetical protein
MTAARALALDITASLGERFECILPGHEGHEARLHPIHGRGWRYECDVGEELGLAEVRASLAYGQVRRRISAIEAALWRARLECEAGLRTVELVLPELPAGASDPLCDVAQGWALLVALRDTEPHPFARSFVAAWCDVSTDQARHAVRDLERLKVIRRVGTVRVGSHEAILWLPGEAS